MARRGARRRWDGSLPGQWWAWLAVLLFISYGASTRAPLTEVPGCSSRTVAGGIDRMTHASPLERAAILGSGYEHAGIPQVGELAELGHFQRNDVRACRGVATFGRIERAFGYTVRLDAKADAGYVLKGGAVAILDARLGHLDRYRHGPDYAKPVGESKLEQAFWAGVDTLPDAARERQAISDVQSSANCSPFGVNAYHCRLLAARNDPVLAAAGGLSATLMDGVFTVELDTASGLWRPAASFPEEFRKAAATAGPR